ncbi:unnamed protein product [Ambrosiozyma monospora]|uniref:Unnamed protein product n=1 Tax=Ambrosiozyma monospora TaxID=43982 RepID=A0ACB5SWZ6_AMBMO|nr:unnamed protein product [Ambrosiozyma monospora]
MSDWSKVPKEFYTNLGKSGLKISRLVAGCMSFGSKKSWGDWIIEDKKEVFAILKKAYDEGIRTFDTADIYCNGQSEVLLGEFLEEYKIKRDKVVILTKCFFISDPDNPELSVYTSSQYPAHDYINSQGLSKKHIFDAVRASVERLGTYIDVLQIHRFDHETPMEETMEALHDVVKEGLTRYIGASSMKAYEFVQLQSVAEKHGWTKFISMQNYFNLLYREEDREMNEYCKKTGVGIIPWSPNAAGALSRPLEHLHDSTRAQWGGLTMLGLDKPSDNDKEIIKRVGELAEKHKVSMTSVSISYVLWKGYNPIVGFNKPSRVDDAIDGFKLKLTDEEAKYLEEPYKPKPSQFVYKVNDDSI